MRVLVRFLRADAHYFMPILRHSVVHRGIRIVLKKRWFLRKCLATQSEI